MRRLPFIVIRVKKQINFMKSKFWEEFLGYGSGFEIEGMRDCQKKENPMVFHLRMFGLIYPDGYELVGSDLERLLAQAMRDGDKKIFSLNQLKVKESKRRPKI